MALKKISTTQRATGAGYYATRNGNTVLVEITNWSGETITLPWVPAYQARATLFQIGSGSPARCIAAPDGTLKAHDTSGTGSLFGQITYLT